MTGGDRTDGPAPLLREGIDWITRRHSGQFSPQDQAELRRWRELSPDHDAAYREAAALGEVAREVGRELVEERRRAAAQVIPFRRPAVSRRAVLAGAMAASTAGVLVIGRSFDLFDGRVPDYATTTGERRTIRLAEGLVLELDAETSIAIDKAAFNRIELIAGRAVVEADFAQGEDFTLLAGSGEVVANRARFDIRLDGGEACVTCLDGALVVAHGAARVPLGSRQQLSYTEAGLGHPALVDPAEVTAWTNGQLVFHQTPLAQVVREVNRYRKGNVMIARSSVGDKLVNGVFYTARIDDAIAQIQQITGARAVHLPGGLIVLS